MDAFSKERPKNIPHGGDLSAAENTYGRPSRGWLDLSTGINPRPYPVTDIGPESYRKLPQRDSREQLKQAAKEFYGTPGADNVTSVPGTQALIQWLPRLREVSRVAIIGPTYGEHFRAWKIAGHPVTMCANPEKATDDTDTDVVVVVNPNNPDGHRFSPDLLEAVRERLAQRGGWLVIDEAFADVAQDLSLAGRCEKEGLIIMRSFGKFFGLAGVRLGFALTNAALSENLTEALGPWAVSGPAEAIGIKALADTTWIEETRKALEIGKQNLEGLLARQGLEITGGTNLFTLVHSEKAGALHAHLAGQGIWTRLFPDHPQWLRFGQPGDQEDWDRLSTALAD